MTCKLCKRAYSSEPHIADTVLAETRNFIATPSVGAIVEGWLLISSKEHMLCFGQMPFALEEELLDFQDSVRKMLAKEYGRIVAFEHGPAQPNSAVGCTVDHAHLHLVPTNALLRQGADDFLRLELKWKATRHFHGARSAFARGSDYLFVEEDGACWIATEAASESQVFRRVIAAAVGRPGEFDWRTHPNVSNIVATVKRLKDKSPQLAMAD